MTDDGEQHEGPARTSPYPVSRLAPPHSLVEAARQIEKADAMMGAVVSNQLQVIVDQIRRLQDHAKSILERAAFDAKLHRAAAAFEKRVGKTYHLYDRGDDEPYFSMLSPEEWGEPPHSYLGSYRLEPDMSWTPLDSIDERDTQRDLIDRLITG